MAVAFFIAAATAPAPPVTLIGTTNLALLDAVLGNDATP
jgi:hypothetical protein